MAELGNGVKVFGDGPDGGREATFDGPVPFPQGEDEQWDGYGVIQAKYRVGPSSPKDNLQWLIKAIRDELKYWRPRANGELNRKLRPKYFLLVTNVRLSPGADQGVDNALDVLRRESSAIGVRDVAIWHYDTLCRFLDQHPRVRQTYGGFLTTGDVLEQLHRFVSGPGLDDLATHLRVHAGTELIAKQWIRLGESGFDGSQKLLLGDAAIDLPAEIDDGITRTEVQVVAHVLAQGDQSLKPTERGTVQQGIVVVGGPGQGKSTLAQLVCQTYRSALIDLEGGASLGPEADLALTQFRTSLSRLRLPPPNNKRWPVYIDLAKLSDHLSEPGARSVTSYIATQVQVEGDSPSPKAMLGWLKSWPNLIVFDGLDEVPSADARDDVVKAISGFVVEINGHGCDSLLLATTRPQGYNGEFGAFQPQTLELRALREHESIAYANRITEIRHSGDPDMVRAIQSRFAVAVREPTTARLVTTPLQATIMTYLLEKHNRAPQSRHALFALYYDTIYARETGKPGNLSKLLNTFREDIDFIHDQAGLLLQIQGEQFGEAEASLELGQLQEIVVERLVENGHPPDAVDSLAQELMKAATDRVVLLVGVRGGQIGFEVRSLQEFMAARAVTTGPPEEVLDRLKPLGPSAHWRYVWLLAAGRIFGTSPYMRDGLIGVLRALDAEPFPSASLLGFGERLALDLLEDDLAIALPAYRRTLLAHALGVLKRWPSQDLVRLARLLDRVGLDDDEIARRMVVGALAEACADSAGPSRLSAWVAAGHMARLSTRWGALGETAREKLSTALAIQQSGPPYPENLGELVDAALDQSELQEDDSQNVSELIELLRRRKYSWTLKLTDSLMQRSNVQVPIQEAVSFRHLLANFRIECAVVTVTRTMNQDQVEAAMWLRQLLQTTVERREVGSDSRVITALAGPRRAAREPD